MMSRDVISEGLRRKAPQGAKRQCVHFSIAWNYLGLNVYTSRYLVVISGSAMLFNYKFLLVIMNNIILIYYPWLGHRNDSDCILF